MYMSDGVIEETIVLDHPGRCLLVDSKDWHAMHFSGRAVLLVMSSNPYDRSEYIDTAYERAAHD